MKKTRLESEYYEWIVGLAADLCMEYGSYERLFGYLYSKEFFSDVGNDRNRIEDGKELRLRFLNACSHGNGRAGQRSGEGGLDFPCSMLEMMVALAIRCEEHIIGDPGDEDSAGQWLYTMLENLHLAGETDTVFDEGYTRERIDIFLSHAYSRNGDGGLFSIKNSRRDMRKVEIWYQMCWYLDEVIDP